MTRILVVDDVPDNVKLLAYDLEDEGYDVITAYNGYQALTSIEKHKPDLILLDIMMPDLDGLEVCRRLKKNPEHRNIPIILISAKGSDEDVIAGLDQGAMDYIVKPFHYPVVSARVRSAARIKRYQDMIHEMNASLDEARSIAESLATAKSDFLAKMSHEIRTPMNGILGSAALLDSEDLTVEQRELLTVIQSSGTALLDLINDILDYSKGEAGKLELDMKDFNLAQLIEETLNLVSEKAHAKKLQINCELSESVSPFLIGDPARLRQILLNFLSNAIKFTEKGEVTLRVTGSNSKSPNEIDIAFAVEDTGLGMTEEEVEHLFVEYYQAQHSNENPQEGTGLGLCITQQLCHLMRGRIEVQSAPGEGSIFTATIPFKEREPNENEIIWQLDICDKKALIVDAFSTSQRILADFLKRMGFSVRTACSQDQALEIITAEDTPFDCIYIDNHLPNCSGIVLGEKIRVESGYNKTPITLLTHGYSEYNHEQLKTWVFNDMLVKPLYFSKVKTNVARLFDIEIPSNTAKPDSSGSKLQPLFENPVRVLLAEDNPTNQMIAEKMLKNFGAEVDIVENGRLAVAAYTTKPYDVILMDCHMPVMDGLSATQAIRQMEDPKAPTPILALTASAMQDNQKECLEAGMNDFIAKPVVPNKLYETLNKWVHDHNEPH